MALGFCFHVRKLLSIFGQIPSSRFQVPRFKGRQQTNNRVFQAPLRAMELGTWNLELGFFRLSQQVPDPPWPNCRFQVPRTHFQESSKEQRKFQETLERGQVPRFLKFQWPSSQLRDRNGATRSQVLFECYSAGTGDQNSKPSLP